MSDPSEPIPDDPDAYVEPPPRVIPAGTVFGDRYEVEEILQKGGMGDVYVGKDRRLSGRAAVKVAIKVLYGTKDGPEVHRFRREARVSAEMRGSNVVSIFDTGYEHDVAYMVMELLNGHDLEQHLERFGVYIAETLDELLRIVCLIAHALCRAHEKGILHRDIKPANIFLRMDGGELVPVILDFGIAGHHGERSAKTMAQTKVGMVLGTPGYMSYRQTSGNEKLGPLDDLYSLSVVIYQAVTGFLPFDHSKGKTQGWQLMADIRKEMETPGALAFWMSQLPEWMHKDEPKLVLLRQLLERGLAPQSDRRFTSTTEFVALLDALAGIKAPRTPTPNPPKTGRVDLNAPTAEEEAITSEPDLDVPGPSDLTVMLEQVPQLSGRFRRSHVLAALGFVAMTAATIAVGVALTSSPPPPRRTTAITDAGVTQVAFDASSAASSSDAAIPDATPLPDVNNVAAEDASTAAQPVVEQDAASVVDDGEAPATPESDAGTAETTSSDGRHHGRERHSHPARHEPTAEELAAREAMRRLERACCRGTQVMQTVSTTAHPVDRCPPTVGSNAYQHLRCGQ